MKKTNLLIKLISMILVLSFALFAFASCDSQEEPNVDDSKDSESTDDKDTSGDQDTDGANDSEGTVGSGDDNPPAAVTYTLDGADGKSGYQIALETGFEGTINEWLDHFADTEDAEKAEELRELLTTKHQLRVNEDGSFKVLVLSDVQSNSRVLNKEILSNIKTVCEREQPDLVIFNGDNSFDIPNAASLKTYVSLMAGWCEANKIPWAHVYGNHDDETPVGEVCVPKAEQQEIYESFEYCVSKAGDPDISGIGNYVLPVYTYDGTAIAFNVWGLDSGSYAYPEDIVANVDAGGNSFYGHYAGMQTDQVNWYYNASKTLEKFQGDKILGMMAFHIPFQEVWTAWSQKEALGLEWDGEKRENISAYAKNCGLFDKITSRKDVKLVVNSHDHINDFSVTYKGVKFAYTACIGTQEYHADDMLGGRVINFSMENPTDFETHMSYVNERVEIDPSAPVLELVIGDDGKVSNGVVGGLELTDYTTKTSSKSVTKDTAINKNVVTFNPNATMWTSTGAYLLPSSRINDTLKDGFSLDVFFKVDNVDKFDKYVGIVDYEELGGFGLNIIKSGDKYVLSFEFACGPDSAGRKWIDITGDFNIGEWTHCVCNYTGPETDKIELYINGVLAASAILDDDMVIPVFNGANAAISIGACTDAKNGSVNGFTGSIAACNIYPEPVTATEVTAFYNAIK